MSPNIATPCAPTQLSTNANADATSPSATNKRTNLITHATQDNNLVGGREGGVCGGDGVVWG